MKSILAPLLCGSLLAAGTAYACDDHHGECSIEDWRWIEIAGMNSVLVDGSATCDEGEMALRIYEGEGGQFLGSTKAHVEQHIFQALFLGVQSPGDIAIKYSIKPTKGSM